MKAKLQLLALVLGLAGTYMAVAGVPVHAFDGKPPRCPNDPSCRPPRVNPRSCCPGQ